MYFNESGNISTLPPNALLLGASTHSHVPTFCTINENCFPNFKNFQEKMYGGILTIYLKLSNMSITY